MIPLLLRNLRSQPYCLGNSHSQPFSHPHSATTPAARKIFVALFFALSPAAASATESSCAVVKPTPDGFVALRRGPGANFPIVQRLRPYDSLWVDTGKCRQNLCDESRKWQFIESVPRLDQNEQSLTQGWIHSTYIQQIVCPSD
jgi:hypothetical protein